MTTPYKSKFQESGKSLWDKNETLSAEDVLYAMDSMGVNENKAKRVMMKLGFSMKDLDKFYSDKDHGNDEQRLNEEPEQVELLIDELNSIGIASDEAREIAIDFVSGDERREDAYEKVSSQSNSFEGKRILDKYKNDLEYDSIYPGT